MIGKYRFIFFPCAVFAENLPLNNFLTKEVLEVVCVYENKIYSEGAIYKT